ncbi:hypothetical protein GEZ85_09840 [Streptococcus mitis]|uniref:Uncharacterized protein n=2 Tax=Streptococcus mitis TaxID=28037 RepID=A0A6I1ULB6_STRMT|nr:hypothetical protein [Streptococcus mitis]EOB22359.1 hypothetical protein D064_03654 [Streptococcus mitis 11/5]MQP83807.1 hypothetical protein [Streptococcus mitis]MQQ41695.1 hypothetical protein [Streptococcus mitis]MQQ62755.1 hypothetical protein [Streptococcus mitis]
MNKKDFEEKNGPKTTVSNVAKGFSPTRIVGKALKIKVYIGISLSLLVVAIVASILFLSPNEKKESNEAIPSIAKKENKSQESTDNSKASEIKQKEEEIQKLKDQLASLDSKVAESEKLVDKLKEETAVLKLDIEALRNNDLSSLKGIWRTASGNEYVINESGEMRSSWLSNGQKNESIVELKASGGKNSQNPETVFISAWVKDSVAGGFIVVAIPSGIVLESAENGKFTDKSNPAEDRLVAGQSYVSMLMKPEDVYYRVKPDTSKLEEEEKNLAQLQAEREAIKTSLESKEKKNTN